MNLNRQQNMSDDQVDENRFDFLHFVVYCCDTTVSFNGIIIHCLGCVLSMGVKSDINLPILLSFTQSSKYQESGLPKNRNKNTIGGKCAASVDTFPEN